MYRGYLEFHVGYAEGFRGLGGKASNLLKSHNGFGFKVWGVDYPLPPAECLLYGVSGSMLGILKRGIWVLYRNIIEI